jgi:hypothetical protein
MDDVWPRAATSRSFGRAVVTRREVAFHERCKIHDIIMQGIDAALKKRGYPSIDDLKIGRKR